MHTSLIYPHQLFHNHPAVQDGRTCLMLEDPMFFGNDSRWPMSMHKQKLVLHRASMAAYADGMKHAQIVENPGGGELDGIAWLDAAIPKKITDLHFCDLVDDVVARRLARLAEKRGITLHAYPSPNFFFLRNPRLSMMARNWGKMGAEKQDAHRSNADAFLKTLEKPAPAIS